MHRRQTINTYKSLLCSKLKRPWHHEGNTAPPYCVISLRGSEARPFPSRHHRMWTGGKEATTLRLNIYSQCCVQKTRALCREPPSLFAVTEVYRGPEQSTSVEEEIIPLWAKAESPKEEHRRERDPGPGMELIAILEKTVSPGETKLPPWSHRVTGPVMIQWPGAAKKRNATFSSLS